MKRTAAFSYATPCPARPGAAKRGFMSKKARKLPVKGKGGRTGKSPRFLHARKREAEAAEVKGQRRIRNPARSIKELFHS
jgi:hypothetical protein